MRRPLIADIDQREREAFLALVPGVVGFVECEVLGWFVHYPDGRREPLRSLAVALIGWDGVLRIAPDA